MNITKRNFDFVILSTYQQLYVFQNFPSNVMVFNVGYFTTTLKVECNIKMPHGCSVTDNDRMHHHRILFAISEDSVIFLLWWGILLFGLCWRLNFGSAEYWCVEYFNTLNKTSTIFVERTELKFQLNLCRITLLHTYHMLIYLLCFKKWFNIFNTSNGGNWFMTLWLGLKHEIHSITKR